MPHHRGVVKLEPGAKLGPYQILGELGRGGMATVYRAYQPNLEREVAIKILPEFLVEQPGFKARFHREAVAVARLQHPNILSVFDHGEQDGVTYIVSEYVEGGTLASRMGAPIQLDYCVRILRPVADALDYAHSEGVIHRDVKPSNILLDRRGVPILSDFGLARVSEESERLTQTGAMVGTPTYMAPEQCSGGDVGAPADIYSLAVIAFEMVTGRVPFTAPNPLGVIAAHQMQPPPSPRKFNPSLPASIEQPLLAGLAKDPARRPETAADFVEALAAAIPSSASQYPMTPPPVTPMPSIPPTPTAIEPPLPPPSYPSVAAPPSSAQLTPAPPAPPPPQYTPPPPQQQQYTPPPSAPGVPYAAAPYAPPASYPPQAVAPSYPAPAPYATASATPPPPSYPAMAVQPQQQYTPAPGYAPMPQQQWAPQPARPATPPWVVVALWAAVAVSVVVALAAIIAPFNTAMDDTTRWVWVAFGVLAAAAASGTLAAVLGIGFRVGAGARLGSAAGVGLVLLLALGGANAYGLGQKSNSALVTGGASPSARPSACTIIKPDTAITMNAVGTTCGLTAKAVVTALDCTSVTALPGPLKAASWDFKTQAASTAGTLSIDSAGCHLVAPTYRTTSELDSSSKVDPSNVLMVADFQQPQGKMDVVLSYGCDDTGCISTDLFTVDGSVYIGEDSNSKVASHNVSTLLGVNRLVLVIQGSTIQSWFNGTMVATATSTRAHTAGYYEIWVEDSDQSAPAALQLMRFGVIDLA